MPALPPSHPPITPAMFAGWIERGRRMVAEARRTKSPRLRIMARNHLRGLRQRIAEEITR